MRFARTSAGTFIEDYYRAVMSLHVRFGSDIETIPMPRVIFRVTDLQTETFLWLVTFPG
jgi:hypothetical protein